VPALLATLALVASVVLASPAPRPLHEDARESASLAHAASATLHSQPPSPAARTARFAPPHPTFDLPPPPAILGAPRAWTLAHRAGSVHAQRVRDRDLRAQAPRAPPPRRS
jgi:hypothetical protein